MIWLPADGRSGHIQPSLSESNVAAAASWVVSASTQRTYAVAGSSARRRIARGAMDSVPAPASSPAPNGGSARPKRPRRLNPSCSAQLRPYVRMYFQCSALSSAYLASMFTDVEALLCASPRSVFQQPWLEKLDLQHHVFVGWLLRATREDSVTMLTRYGL